MNIQIETNSVHDIAEINDILNNNFVSKERNVFLLIGEFKIPIGVTGSSASFENGSVTVIYQLRDL